MFTLVVVLAQTLLTVQLAYGHTAVSKFGRDQPAQQPLSQDGGPFESTPRVAPTIPPSKLTGRLPALGWNSWNAYRWEINEAKVLATASQFISLGLKDAGYEYINIDDCWHTRSRDSKGRMVPDPAKFPNGIKSMAEKIHSMGLKIGIYSDAGTETCAGFPGSLGYEVADATLFGSWGIDYLKYDNCNFPANWSDTAEPPDGDWYKSNTAIRYRRMTAALAAQPHPIQFSLCAWGLAHVWEWGARVGHSWRMSFDSAPSWTYISDIININANLLETVGFNGHNDMDMMEIGNGDLTIQEQRTHFAAWAFMKSPILLGANLGNLTSIQLSIIKNAELLAFHQDPTIGEPAKPFTAYPGMPLTEPPEYYSGRSRRGIHVFIINTSGSSAMKSFILSNVPGLKSLGGSGKFTIHDMWTGEDVVQPQALASMFFVNVEAHDTLAYLIKPI